MPVDNAEIMERLRLYTAEFSALLRSGVPRDLLLNGDGSRHGLNHINELFQMLPSSNKAEFRIRE